MALIHARAHASSALAAPDAENLTFELEHLTSHIREALEHQRKYVGAIAEIFPAVAAELTALARLADLGAAAGTAQRSAASDGRVLLAQMMACDPLSDEELGGDLSVLAAYEKTRRDYAAGSRWAGAI